MNWNRKEGNWAELKGQAKRQQQNQQNDSSNLIGINNLRYEVDSQENLKVIKTRADRKLTELEDLLR